MAICVATWIAPCAPAGNHGTSESGTVGKPDTVRASTLYDYLEKNLQGGVDGFRHLVGEDLTGLLVNRTLLLRHKRNKDIKIFMFHHQNGDQYIKILGVNKFKGKVFKAPYQIRDGVRHATSISTGEAIRSRFYGNDDEFVWTCGGTRGGCSYYSEESWDGDPQNLKK